MSAPDLSDPGFIEFLAKNATPADRAKFGPYLRQVSLQAEMERDYEAWLNGLFPAYVTAPLAPHHHDLWRWIWALRRGISPETFMAIWNRGGAKSTSAEMGCVAVGARRARRYGLYICEVQDQADDHVQNVGSMLESKEIAQAYPDCRTD